MSLESTSARVETSCVSPPASLRWLAKAVFRGPRRDSKCGMPGCAKDCAGTFAHPGIPHFESRFGPLKTAFASHLREAGGEAYDVPTPAGADSKLIELHPQAEVICSAAREIAGTRRIENVSDPHDLADVDVGIVRAQFGVAESGAVWLTQDELGLNALAFLCQHLIVLLDPHEIVPSLHEAYGRVRLDSTAYGCFMMGPSATADVEATLIRGAQGPRSLNLFFLES
jgi:L-lactate dehydrogenase complex protein LldG